MNKKLVLEALKNQVADLQTKYDTMQQTVVTEKLNALNERVKSELTSILSFPIHGANMESSTLEIYPTSDNDRWDRLQIHINTGYANGYKDTFKYCELSSWSTRLRSDKMDDKSRTTLVVLGAVAFHFETISKELMENWSVDYDNIVNELNQINNQMYKLNREVDNMEYSIADDEKSEYKKVGFECQVKDRWNFDWNYNDDNEKVYTINKDKCYFNLSTGRSKWDYCNVWWFKVTKRNNYKTTIQYKTQHEGADTRTVEVSNKKFDSFINDVYNWQSTRADENNEKVQKRYDEAVAEQAKPKIKVNLSKVKSAKA